MDKESEIKKLSVIGKSVPRVDAVSKVTGKARFTADFKEPGMLYAKVLRSPYPHAKIKAIDISKVGALPGVRRVIKPEEAPEKRGGLYIADRYVLPRDGIVRFVGAPVAIVVADSKTIAQEALDLIDVQYELLPTTFDSEEAMGKDPPVVIHPDLHQYTFVPIPRYPKLIDPDTPNVFHISKIRCGDIEKGFSEADLIVENRYSSARLQACPLEPVIADAWIDEEGNLIVRSSRQGVYMAATAIAELFDVPASKVRAMSPYVGGAFGSKVDTWIECLAVLAAIKTRKPVRLEYSREEEFIAAGQRPGTVVYMKDGLKKDGTIVAREIKVIFDAGGYGAAGAYISTNVCMWSLGGTYRFPNFKSDTYSVYTNNPPTCTFRAVETPEVTWATESQMDVIAEKLGLDPLEVRRRNLLRDGEKTIWGETVHNINPIRCLETATNWINWNDRPQEGGVWRKGKGLAIAGYITLSLPGSAIVKIHPEGLIEARVGPDELGQGFETVVAQICAEEFSVSIDSVRVVRGDTKLVPFSLPSIASQLTVNIGNATLRACQDAKNKLFLLAADRLGVAPENLETLDGMIHVKDSSTSIPIEDVLSSPYGHVKEPNELLGEGTFIPKSADPVDPLTGQTEMISPVWSHLAYAAEVAVNVETGQIKLLRICAGFDVGQTVNIKGVEGQIEGSIGMGMSAAFYEQIILENGVVTNPNFQDYKLATSFEIPSGDRIKCISVGVPDPYGPYGAKGAGELPNVPIAPVLGNAVFDATRVRIKDLPITKERVLEALYHDAKAR